MLRNHASTKIGSIGTIVNSFVTALAVLMIAAGYFTAIAPILVA